MIRALAHRMVPIVVVLIGVLAPLSAIELALRAELISPDLFNRTQTLPNIDVTDPLLGFRPNPEYPSHDSNGWRNEKALERADIVAFGDSQTYGLGAERSESWPAVLASLTSKATYQFAFGGYGPAHYLALVDQALALRPKIIVASVYFGNDVLDSYWLVYRPDTIPNSRRRSQSHAVLDGLVSTSPRIRESVAKAERIDPNHIRHKYLDCQTYREIPAPGLQTVSSILDSTELAPLEQIKTPREIEVEHRESTLRIIQLAWRAYDNFRDDADRRKIYSPPICIPFEWMGKRVVFSPAYRLLTLDDSDPRVVEGKRIVIESLLELAKIAKSKGAQFYVLLIPTKEYVFRNEASGKIESAPWLDQLWNQEDTYRRQLVKEVESRGIQTIDSLPALRESLAAGVVPYPNSTGLSHMDADGHPNAAGYRKIAEAVAARLTKNKSD